MVGVGGTPHPRSGRGVPYPVWTGVGWGTSSSLGWGVSPSPRSGQEYPIQSWMGVPQPVLDRGYPRVPPISRMGYPLSRPGMGYPPSRPGMGYHPCLDLGWGTTPLPARPEMECPPVQT